MTKVDFADGTILSGAMINTLAKDLFPRFSIYFPVTGVLSSGDGVGEFTNSFGTPLKIIAVNFVGNARWEMPKATPLVSGDYLPIGSVMNLYATAGTTLRGNSSFMISGGTINGA